LGGNPRGVGGNLWTNLPFQRVKTSSGLQQSAISVSQTKSKQNKRKKMKPFSPEFHSILDVGSSTSDVHSQLPKKRQARSSPVKARQSEIVENWTPSEALQPIEALKNQGKSR